MAFDFENFDQEARKRIVSQLNLWALDADWHSPTPEDVRNLQRKVEDSSITELSCRSDIKEEDLDAFAAAEITPAYVAENSELIRKLGETVASSLLVGEDQLSLDVTHRVRIWHSCGGPNCYTDIILDGEHRPVDGESVFAWGDKIYRMPLGENEIDAVWAEYEGMDLDPAQGPRMG